MPFRSFHKAVKPGKGVHLYTAEAEDQEVHVRAAAFGDGNMSVGFSFEIGGPDLNESGGLVCFDSEWGSSVEEGDELWIKVMDAAFTDSTPITVIVRSGKRSDRAVQPHPQKKTQAAPNAKQP